MNHQPRHRSARRILALAVVGAFGLAACGGDDVAKAPVAESASNSAAFGLVLPQQALELSGNIDVTVIDVRTPEEFAEGHIDGATMIDFYEASFSDDIAALDHDGTYLLYCRSGNRSGQTAALMQQLGFDQVYDMEGGVVAYSGQGLPLVP